MVLTQAKCGDLGPKEYFSDLVLKLINSITVNIY